MTLVFKFFLCIFYFFSFNIQAFDVRVLLERFIINDKGLVECKISSQHGMVISCMQDNPLFGPVSILCTEKEFIINGVHFSDEMLIINPVLPKNYAYNIDQFVLNWYKKNHHFCQQRFFDLDHFYTAFVNDRDFRDYEPLYRSLQDCINQSILVFIDSIEHPVISYQSLVAKAEQQLADRLKILFTQCIKEKKVSKGLMRQLQKSSKARSDFFVKILEKTLLTFLSDYFINLPHKIIEQVMKEETGCLFFHKHRYLGTFYLIKDSNSVLLINSLDIDDYLFSVLYSEGWPGWPMEVYKTLVIASRTYLVKKIVQAHKSKRLYHIVNSIKHQTYKGHHTCIQLKKAVDETRNIFIAYKGEPIEAMFDSCCGSVIPAKIEGPDYKNHAYLARKKACYHCKKFKIYEWKKEFTRLEITEILRQDYPDLSEIIDIKVTKKDAAGLVQQVCIVTKKQNIYISGKKIYSLFSSVKSFCYTIKKKGKNFIFQGRGFGHHMGLCQWGSLGMVQDNWSYRKILEFYYPGTEFMKLSLSR